MSAYKTVLMTKINDEDIQLEFDVLNTKSVSTNSQITTHPLVTGDIIADHMYRNPASMSLAGSFSLAGNKRTDFGGSADRLANIEEIFEKIKNDALLCKLITVNEDDNKQTRFKIRENMVLKSIRWAEYQNSLDFNFDFDEVMLIDAFDVPYDVDVTDPSLPALTDPRQLDFTDTLIDWNEVGRIVIDCCKKWGLMTQEFVQKCLANVGKMVAVGAVGAALIGVATAIAVACGASGPIGWIAGAIIAGVAAIGYAWYKIFQSVGNLIKQRKFRIKQFKYYAKDDKKNEAELNRFLEFNDAVFKQIDQLEDAVFLYGFSSNENQECTFYLDNEYYIFKFERKTNGYYEMKVMDVNGNVVANQSELTGLSCIADCTSSNTLFTTKTGSYVYMMNPSLYEDDERHLAGPEREAYTKDLTKYMVMVTTIKMENFTNMMVDIIKNAVMY